MRIIHLKYATLDYVYDGDSFKCDIEIWPNHKVNTMVRLARIDASEFRGVDKDPEKAQIAKEALVKLLPSGKRDIFLEVERLDKYGRVLAEVMVGGPVSEGGFNVSNALLDMSVVRPYAMRDVIQGDPFDADNIVDDIFEI